MHIVWDWNGTLFDDLSIVIEAANVSLGRLGAAPIDEDSYRDHFTRPVRAFYDSLFGRFVTDEEWHLLNDTFHDEYMARADRAELTVDAEAALSAAEANGWTQSLLSMSPQDWLSGIVARKGIANRFVAVDGLTAETGGLKADHLAEHVRLLDRPPSATVIVGDTPDDAVAARHLGAQVILYDGGSHHLPTLEGMGAPVAHTLVEAVDLVARL